MEIAEHALYDKDANEVYLYIFIKKIKNIQLIFTIIQIWIN